jgi:selenide,water dikinase
VKDPNLLVGIDTGDDAAVYRLTDDLCIIQTVDFFPPIVDDPYQYGAISAANSLSDVYAMGGKPILALNLVCFPEDQPISILGDILRGGADIAHKAGVLTVGGHTIQDKEPKYGLSVTGVISPDKIVSNVGARPFDKLVLTKAIGTGIITTAAKAGLADAVSLENAIASMMALNLEASNAMVSVGVNAATDVTGFGLIGHLHNMMKGSSTTATLNLNMIPILPGARELAESGVAPGGTRRNLDTVGRQVEWDSNITVIDQLLLCDAQTSGGLLIAVEPRKIDLLMRKLGEQSVVASIIGEVGEAENLPIRVTT